MVSDFDLEKIMKAKEMVCPSIFMTFHHGDEFSFGSLCIDYIQSEYKLRSQVISDYMTNGNSKEFIKGYGNLNNLEDLKAEDLKVKYYFDITSYLYDPDRCRPVDTTPSTYKKIDPRDKPELIYVLGKFVEYLKMLEKEYEKMEEIESISEVPTIFHYEEFSTPAQVRDILDRNEHLLNFNELITDSNYFNKKYF